MPPTGRRHSFSTNPSTWVVHSRWPTRTRWVTRSRVPAAYRGFGGVGVMGPFRGSRRLLRFKGADILLAARRERQGATPTGRDEPSAAVGRGRGEGARRPSIKGRTPRQGARGDRAGGSPPPP